jgi:uncharacterized protein with HEPN domain
MLDSAHAIQKYMEGVTYNAFWEDAEKRDAVTMRISVIGEAARFILPPTAAMLPKIPFPKIRGMRNHITHDYKGIDYTEVWNVTMDHIPLLISELEGYFTLHPIPTPVETAIERIRAHSKAAIQKATPADSPPEAPGMG